MLDRTVVLLDLVADGGVDGLPLKELAARSGLNTATCHRILNTLVGHKLLARDNRKRRYRLGARMAIYGVRAARGPGIISRCEVALTRLRRRTGDTTHLMARFNHDSVCLDRRDGECIVPTLTGSVGGFVPSASALARSRCSRSSMMTSRSTSSAPISGAMRPIATSPRTRFGG